MLHICAFSGFVLDGKRIYVQSVGQLFAKLHGFQPARVRLPDFPVIDVPLFPLRHKAGFLFVPVRKQIAVAYIVEAVPLVVLRRDIHQ